MHTTLFSFAVCALAVNGLTRIVDSSIQLNTVHVELKADLVGWLVNSLDTNQHGIGLRDFIILL